MDRIDLAESRRHSEKMDEIENQEKNEDQKELFEEILENAIERRSKGQPLSLVETDILGSWLPRAERRLSELRMASQEGFLKDEQYREMQELVTHLGKLGRL